MTIIKPLPPDRQIALAGLHLDRAVEDFLAKEYPEGTRHPADSEAALLLRALQQFRAKVTLAERDEP